MKQFLYFRVSKLKQFRFKIIFYKTVFVKSPSYECRFMKFIFYTYFAFITGISLNALWFYVVGVQHCGCNELPNLPFDVIESVQNLVGIGTWILYCLNQFPTMHHVFLFLEKKHSMRNFLTSIYFNFSFLFWIFFGISRILGRFSFY